MMNDILADASCDESIKSSLAAVAHDDQIKMPGRPT